MSKSKCETFVKEIADQSFFNFFSIISLYDNTQIHGSKIVQNGGKS